MSIEQIIKENKVIGRNKYNHLKKQLNTLNQDDVEALIKFKELNKISVSLAEQKVKDFELKNNSTPNNEKIREYVKSLYSEPKQDEIKLTKEWLWDQFLKHFKMVNGVVFVQNKDSLNNLKTLFYYFLEDFDNLKKCKNVSNLSEVKQGKGIIIVGNYGCGKTSIMNAFESVFKNTNFIFKGITTNDAVMMYEGCENPKEKEEVMKLLTTGRRYFDDVKTEKQASNYGKTELFKEVFEIRNRRKLISFITMNYKKEKPNNLHSALDEYKEKYGGRNYDRIFEDFIIIEFEGRSFRK